MDRQVEHAAYDVEAVRRDFPILARTVYGKPLVYLDNGASAQKPQAVIDTIAHAYSHEYANVHRGLHFLSNAATDAYERARETVRGFLNAQSVDEIVFTRSATASINTVAYGWGMPHIGAGDEIVLSIMEHHSNIVPWHFIRERQGAKLVWAPVDDDGVFHLDAFEKCLTEKTKLVAVTHMSNALGTVTPVKEIVRIAHARGIPVLVDGSQAAVHMPVDVADLGCDWYVLTGHKVYGPSGIGVLYGRKERLAEMRPFEGGGEMIETVTEDTVTYNEPPHRFEAGTPPILEAIGLKAAIDWFVSQDRAAIEAHEAVLRDRAMAALGELNWVKLHGRAPEKGAIVAFSMEGAHPHDVAQILDRQGVAVRAGHHCAQPLMRRLGVTATARASFACYNRIDEVDALIEALHKARKLLS